MADERIARFKDMADLAKLVANATKVINKKLNPHQDGVSLVNLASYYSVLKGCRNSTIYLLKNGDLECRENGALARRVSVLDHHLIQMNRSDLDEMKRRLKHSIAHGS